MGFLINISPSLSFFLSLSQKKRGVLPISLGSFCTMETFSVHGSSTTTYLICNNHQTRYFESRTRSIYSKTKTRGRHLVLRKRKHAPSDPADKIGGRKTNSAIPRPLDPSIIDSKQLKKNPLCLDCLKRIFNILHLLVTVLPPPPFFFFLHFRNDHT